MYDETVELVVRRLALMHKIESVATVIGFAALPWLLCFYGVMGFAIWAFMFAAGCFALVIANDIFVAPALQALCQSGPVKGVDK